jgi:hypothetical protein
LREIIHLIRYIRGKGETIIIRHIKGHQDRISNNLTYEARLNVEADRMASDSLNLPPTTTAITFPSSKALIFIDNKLVSSNYKEHLRNAFTILPYREHINNINNWANDTFDLVWWEVHGKAIDKYGPYQQLMLQKYFQKRLPTNKRENKYYKYISSGCSVCQQLETQEHLLTCTACEARRTTRDQYLVDTKKYLQQTHCSPATIHTICSSIRRWFQGEDFPTDIELQIYDDPILAQAYNELLTIGWNQWFYGRIAKSWTSVYTRDINRTIRNVNNGPRLPSSEVWATKLVVMTLGLVHACWQHRNDREHGTNEDPIANQKDKLIRKIMWFKTKIDYFPNNYLRSLTEEILKGLPLANLKMTDSQLQILARANKKADTNEENDT